MHAGSLESTRKAQELLEAIAKSNSNFLNALQTSYHNSTVHSSKHDYQLFYNIDGGNL